jgi:hypothetical protein
VRADRRLTLQLNPDGAELYPRILDSVDLAALDGLLPDALRPGTRLYGNPGLAEWLQDGNVGSIARKLLGSEARPVRAILFDKTPEANWALGWHQDRTIAVRQQVDLDGFTHWTTKDGALHVEPPFNLLERMITARIHLDAVTEDNGPLLIAPGSHALGRIEEPAVDDVANSCGTHACLADAGDVWMYRTPILHASDPSRLEGRRRVLQVDFAGADLPGGLQWLGVG